MDLSKLYSMQEELDNRLYRKNHFVLDSMPKGELLNSLILALLVEVGKLADLIGSFKFWDGKSSADKEALLDGFASMFRSYLSVGNEDNLKFDKSSFVERKADAGRTKMFRGIYYCISRFDSDYGLNEYRRLEYYKDIGAWMMMLWKSFGFTDEEIENVCLGKMQEEL